MTEKDIQTLMEQINEIHQAMFGVHGTTDTGICGQIAQHRKIISEFKHRITKLEVVFYGGAALAFIAAMISLFK